MKNSTKIFIWGNLILVISFMAIFLMSLRKAKNNKFSGNGIKVSKVYELPNFNQVNLHSFNYELIHSDRNYVEIYFYENGFGMFDVSVKNNILNIIEKNGTFHFKDYPKIKVYYKKINKLVAKGCQEVKGIVNSDNFEIVSKIFSNVNINFIGLNLTLNAESNAEIKVKGIVKNLNCYGETLAKFYLYELNSESANIELNNNSYAEIFVKENLIAKASSVSEIKYKTINFGLNTKEESKSGGSIKLEK